VQADMNRYQDPWTAEVYDAQVSQVWADGDLGFYLSLAGDCAGPVLELACGTGRVLLPLARHGARVTGLDISPAMLAVARRKLAQVEPEVRARVTLVEGDMSGFSLSDRFGLVLVPFRAFQALLTRDHQRGCLESVSRHLLPDGRFVVNVFHPRLSILAGGKREEPPREYQGADGSAICQTGETEYDVAHQMLRSRVRYQVTASGGEVAVHAHTLTLRYLFRFEFEWMLEACGFEVEALYGSFDRSPFTAESPEMIFVARRAR